MDRQRVLNHRSVHGYAVCPLSSCNAILALDETMRCMLTMFPPLTVRSLVSLSLSLSLYPLGFNPAPSLCRKAFIDPSAPSQLFFSLLFPVTTYSLGAWQFSASLERLRAGHVATGASLFIFLFHLSPLCTRVGKEKTFSLSLARKEAF